MWIARDKDGSLWLYDEKPMKGTRAWLQSLGNNCMQIKDEGVSYLYRDIKWSDKDPREVELILI